MSNRSWALLAALLVGLAFYAGHQRGQAGAGAGLLPVASRPGRPVATFDGISISAEELKAQIEEQPSYVRARYSSLAGKREFLDSIVRFELMAREAQRRGMLKDPEVVRQTKRNLVSLFVQREFEEAQKKIPVPDPELQKFYDEHLSDYVKPERVRVADIFLEAPAADSARRGEKKTQAEALLAQAKVRDPRDFGAFAELARQKTDDPAGRVTGGDLRFLSQDELEKRAGAEVAQAAFALREVGKVHEQVLETAQGFHLIKLLGRENPLNLKLDDVREAIRNRILYDRRSQSYQQFLADLEKKAGLVVEEKALDEVKVDIGPGVPPPGSLPPAPKERVGIPPPPMEEVRP